VLNRLKKFSPRKIQTQAEESTIISQEIQCELLHLQKDRERQSQSVEMLQDRIRLLQMQNI